MIPWREISFTKPRALAPARNRHSLPPFDREAFQAHPLVSLLPRQTVEQFLATDALAEYPKGTVLFRAGDPCDAIFLILSGRCEGRGETGGIEREEIEEVFGPGDVLMSTTVKGKGGHVVAQGIKTRQGRKILN